MMRPMEKYNPQKIEGKWPAFVPSWDYGEANRKNDQI